MAKIEKTNSTKGWGRWGVSVLSQACKVVQSLFETVKSGHQDSQGITDAWKYSIDCLCFTVLKFFNEGMIDRQKPLHI